LERLKGIPLKLQAIGQFMDENPQWKGKLAFALCGISAGERGKDYEQTVHDVKILVNSLNMQYGSPDDPLVYFEERHDRDIRLKDRLAFFSSADILLITATRFVLCNANASSAFRRFVVIFPNINWHFLFDFCRDGLNRYPMEFTLAKKRVGEVVGLTTAAAADMSNHASSPSHAAAAAASSSIRLPGAGATGQGLVIISEFISSARVMRGALTVNPWRIEEVRKLSELYEVENKLLFRRCFPCYDKVLFRRLLVNRFSRLFMHGLAN
jgi:hypothetical protein